METLLTLGVAGSTPLVVQFLIAYANNGEKRDVSLRMKMNISIVTGAVLAIIASMAQSTVPADTVGQLLLVLDGAISGAMATGGVNLGFKIIEKAKAEETIITEAALSPDLPIDSL